MRSQNLRSSALLALVPAAVSACSSPESSVTQTTPDVLVEFGDVRWLHDFDAGLERASDSHKPVLLVFQEVPG